MRKFTKIDVFYMIMMYFMLFVFVGALFNIIVDAVAWSISIFIILWCSYWFYQYMVAVYYDVSAQIDLMIEEMNKDKEE